MKRAAKRVLEVVLRPVVFRYRRLLESTQRATDEAAATRAALDALAAQLRADAEIMGEFSRLSRRVTSDLEHHVEELRALHRHESSGRSLIETPFVIGALSDLPRGSCVVVLSTDHDSLALSLASIGYRVTAHSAEAPTMHHPNLSATTTPIETWAGPGEPVDAVVALDRIDRVVLDHAQRWLRPGGLLVTAVPAGPSADGLLDGWSIEIRRRFARNAHGVWSELESEASSTRGDEADSVALVVATPA